MSGVPLSLRKVGMASKDELAAIRAEIKRLERNTARKLNRLANDKGVDKAAINPIRPGRAKNYSLKQAEAYAKVLTKFNSRRTQYVGGVGGVPLSARQYAKYKRLERKYKENANALFNAVKGVPAPLSENGDTLEDFTKRNEPDYKVYNSTTNKLSGPERSATSFPSKSKLRELINDYETKVRHGEEHFIRLNNAALQQAAQMLAHDPKMLEKIMELSPKQFSVLWNNTNFVNTLSTKFHAWGGTNKNADTNTEFDSIDVPEDDVVATELKRISEDNTDIDSYLTWAGKYLK